MLVVLFSVLFWLFGFLAVPMALVGLGYSSYFWKAILAQMIVHVLLPFIPTPGGSGVGEVGFLYVYSSILPGNGIAGLLTLIWKFLDFYLGLLVGGISFMIVMRDLTRHPRHERLEESDRKEEPTDNTEDREQREQTATEEVSSLLP